MLVNLGDLPQPEQNVLSQTVWSPLERGNSAGHAGPGQGQAPNAGASPRGVVQEYRALTTTVPPPPISVRTASDSASVKSVPSAVRGASGVASPAAAGEQLLTKRPDSSTGESDQEIKRPRL
jgi:hypothetical protein